MPMVGGYAARYRELGLVVVPINEHRRPMFRWTQYRDGLQAYGDDWAMWESDGAWERSHGVGVLTEFSGVVVVDVDVLIEHASAHLKALTGADMSIEAMSHGVSQTQSGRVHLFFTTGDRSAADVPSLSVTMADSIFIPNV